MTGGTILLVSGTIAVLFTSIISLVLFGNQGELVENTSILLEYNGCELVPFGTNILLVLISGTNVVMLSGRGTVLVLNKGTVAVL